MKYLLWESEPYRNLGLRGQVMDPMAKHCQCALSLEFLLTGGLRQAQSAHSCPWLLIMEVIVEMEPMPIQVRLHLCHGNRDIFLGILRDLIFKACTQGLEHNTQQQVVVLVMLINSKDFPDWISFSYALVSSNCLWHQSSSAMQWRTKEWNCHPLWAVHPWDTWG